jgi:hypothetical protein
MGLNSSFLSLLQIVLISKLLPDPVLVKLYSIESHDILLPDTVMVEAMVVETALQEGGNIGLLLLLGNTS